MVSYPPHSGSIPEYLVNVSKFSPEKYTEQELPLPAK